MRVWFDNKCIIGGGGGQKRLHVLVGGGGGKKSYPSSLRGVQKVPNVPFPHLPAPLPINNEHSLRYLEKTDDILLSQPFFFLAE